MALLPEAPLYRPPSEADSVLVRVTRGCSWNRCTFCDMYKSIDPAPRPLPEVQQDLARLRALHRAAGAIFLADSDALAHPDLVAILSAARARFPDSQRVTCYARLTTLRALGAARLADLRAAGLTRVHAGLESGSSAVLARVRKGLKPELAIEASRLATEAGFELSLYVLCGLGGEEDWEEHAEATARVVCAAWPHFLRLRSLVLLPGTPLHQEHLEGTFTPATPLTRLREVRRMVASIAAPEPVGRELELASDHFSNIVWADRQQVYAGVNGRLPAQRDALLAELDRAIDRVLRSTQAADPAALALRGRRFSLYAPTRL